MFYMPTQSSERRSTWLGVVDLLGDEFVLGATDGVLGRATSGPLKSRKSERSVPSQSLCVESPSISRVAM